MPIGVLSSYNRRKVSEKMLWMFMNLPINMIPRKQKQPPKRNSSGAFYFAPRHQM